MRRLWNRLWSRDTLRDCLPYGAALFVLTSLWPCGVEAVHEGLYAYKFGLTPYLTLYQRGMVTGQLNLFQAIGGADGFFVAVPGVLCCGLLCYLLAALFRAAVAHFGKPAEDKDAGATQ